MIKLKPVETKGDWEAFLGFPWEVYGKDPIWVPPLRIAVKDVLDVNKNPFFKHAAMRPWLAYKDGKLSGRVVAVVDEDHNRFHEERTGFFGFFECFDDQEVANALLDVAAKWVKDRGMSVIRGPISPSTNHECGLLVEGFKDPPQVMMTYNPPYYAKLLENWGLAKSKDLLAYKIQKDVKLSERMLAHVEKIKASSSIKFRELNMKDFEGELDRILKIYNDAWEKNWGFVPMNEEEFRHAGKDLKMVVDPRLVLIAEVNGEAVGFSVALPDVNQAQIKIKDGKLLPTGLFKLLWNLKGPGKRKTINRVRIITLGIKRAYQDLALGPMFYTEYFRRAPALGYDEGEASWILEDNIPMNKALSRLCGERYKTYRIYDKAL